MENKLSLYQITDEIAKIEEAIYSSMDQETGEVNADFVEILKTLNVAKEDKLNGCIYVIGKSEDTVELIDKEIKRLQNLKKKHENLQERVRLALVSNIEAGKNIDLGLHKIGWRKSTSTEIADEDKFREKYKDTPYVETKITYSINKTEIKKALQDGVKIEGAELVEKQNLQIK